MKPSLLRECLRVAKEKTRPGIHPNYDFYPHYSFIIQKNKIIEWAQNVSAPPLIKFGYPAWAKQHAEPIAFRRARGIMNLDRPFEVINIRLNRNHELRNSCPCPHCHNFLALLGCTTVYFSTNSGFEKLSIKDEHTSGR